VMELVERLCDHVAVMDAGQVVWAGPLEALRHGRTLEDAFVDLVGEPERQKELSWLSSSRD
jgi:ABC-2 type transport system ATP-binding protein